MAKTKQSFWKRMAILCGCVPVYVPSTQHAADKFDAVAIAEKGAQRRPANGKLAGSSVNGQRYQTASTGHTPRGSGAHLRTQLEAASSSTTTSNRGGPAYARTSGSGLGEPRPSGGTPRSNPATTSRSRMEPGQAPARTTSRSRLESPSGQAGTSPSGRSSRGPSARRRPGDGTASGTDAEDVPAARSISVVGPAGDASSRPSSNGEASPRTSNRGTSRLGTPSGLAPASMRRQTAGTGEGPSGDGTGGPAGPSGHLSGEVPLGREASAGNGMFSAGGAQSSAVYVSDYYASDVEGPREPDGSQPLPQLGARGQRPGGLSLSGTPGSAAAGSGSNEGVRDQMNAALARMRINNAAPRTSKPSHLQVTVNASDVESPPGSPLGLPPALREAAGSTSARTPPAVASPSGGSFAHLHAGGRLHSLQHAQQQAAIAAAMAAQAAAGGGGGLVAYPSAPAPDSPAMRSPNSGQLGALARQASSTLGQGSPSGAGARGELVARQGSMLSGHGSPRQELVGRVPSMASGVPPGALRTGSRLAGSAALDFMPPSRTGSITAAGASLPVMSTVMLASRKFAAGAGRNLSGGGDSLGRTGSITAQGTSPRG
ncbi:hypothetical protein HYH03_002376 [Edaphochlamys debaryana]|uniref:Uncharacterized protein n=1 Tax=Edaphochlamys debaryana TaxID=47281 RepID=A0A835YKM1_9CHLO|nr:hypothetical protein HYH03_002376 [Edaphochlamys debaryana]|eukprot:KAG2499429.1 hypothetical protein HYH03_002376 [Edaphochlamys debaryana]